MSLGPEQSPVAIAASVSGLLSLSFDAHAHISVCWSQVAAAGSQVTRGGSET